MGNLLVHRVIKNNGDGTVDVAIKVKNFGTSAYSFRVHEMLPCKVSGAKPEPKVVTMGNDYDYVWDISAAAGSSKVLSYKIESASEEELQKLPQLIVEGIEEELVTGAKAFKGV